MRLTVMLSYVMPGVMCVSCMHVCGHDAQCVHACVLQHCLLCDTPAFIQQSASQSAWLSHAKEGPGPSASTRPGRAHGPGRLLGLGLYFRFWMQRNSEFGHH